MVGVQVLANGGVGTGGAFAPAAKRGILASHAVHVGRGGAEVADGAFEVGHLAYPVHFAQDGVFGARGDEFPLMGGDGAEGTTPKASPVEGDGMAYHVVGRNGFALVAGVGQACERKVVDSIQFGSREGRVGGIDNHFLVPDGLHEAGSFEGIRLFFDAAEVGSVFLFVGEAFLVGMEAERLPLFVAGDRLFLAPEDDGLRDIGEVAEGDAFAQEAADFREGLFPHAIHQHVRAGGKQDGRHGFVLPIVVMGEPPERGFDAADDDRHVGIQLLEDARVDNRGHIGAHASAPVGGVCVVRPLAPCCRIMVDHGVHCPCRHSEEKARRAQFPEVAQVVAPIGLWHEGYFQPFCFQYAPDDRCTERRMVDVGVA